MRSDLVAALGEAREHSEHGVDGPRRVLAARIWLACGDSQVFAYRQAFEDAAPLWHQGHAARGDHLW